MTIEMKNGIEITGTIEETDANMNLTMHQVKHVSSTGKVNFLDIAFVSGSSILYVHMPPVNLRNHVSSCVSFSFTQSFHMSILLYPFLIHSLPFPNNHASLSQQKKDNYRRKRAEGGPKKRK